MKESIGNAFVFGMFTLFAFLTLLILIVSINYSRANKIKDRLLTLVQNYAESEANVVDGYIDAIDFDSPEFKKLIVDELANLGYRRNNGGFNQNECYDYRSDVKTDELNGLEEEVKVLNPQSDFKYCIYGYKTSRGWYYGVKTYMYFDIPIIGTTLEFPLYGETKVIYQLGV